MHYYMGIDVGTSSVKSLLMDVDGKIIGTAQVGYDIKKKKLQYAEQDMGLIWESTKQTLCELSKQYPEEIKSLKGIGYSGQMHGLVMLDKDGNLLRDAIIWADQRSGKEIEEIYDVIGKDEYRGVILNSLSTGFLISSLMWVKKHEPDVYEKIAYVMFPKDYIRYQMCGEIGTEMTDASSGAIFDTKKRTWAWDMIEKLGLKKEIFPECHESYEVAGTVSAKCAEETGLLTETKIAYGAGDTLMVGVGNGIITPGVLASNIGTSCQIATSVNQPLYDPKFRTNTFCHVKEDLWLVMGAHLSGGVALKWLMKQMLYMNSYDEMTAVAAKAPAGSEGMVFLPYLSGERTPYNDPGAKAIYYGMNLKHDQSHMIRSTMEGIIFGLRNSMDILKSMGVTYNKIIASGGGARGRLFLEMQADNFDCDIYTNEGNEQAGIGAAITAAVACGEYKDYKEACDKIVRLKDTVIEPNRENQKLYEESYAIFKELYGHNQDLFHK